MFIQDVSTDKYVMWLVRSNVENACSQLYYTLAKALLCACSLKCCACMHVSQGQSAHAYGHYPLVLSLHTQCTWFVFVVTSVCVCKNWLFGI